METTETYNVEMKEESFAGRIEEMMDALGVKEMELKNFIRNVTENVAEGSEQAAYYEEGYNVAMKAKKVLEQEALDEKMIEVIVVGALLARTGVVDERYPGSHVTDFHFEAQANGWDEGMNPMFYAAINRMIRGSMGHETAIKEFEPKPGQPEYLVALLFRLEKIGRELKQ